MRILDDRQAADQLSGLQHAAAGHADDMFEAEPLRVRVVLLRAGKLAEPDGHHFHQAAFDAAIEVGVPLHARHDHCGVGRMRGGVHEHFDPIVRLAK